jgi:hypothetical protein
MMAIEKNPDRWRQVHCELAPGEAWDFRVDTESFHDAEYASEYLSFVLNLIKYAGGGIPLIVENSLTDNWQQELVEAAEKPLEDASLAMLAATLKDVPIYVTGKSDLVGAAPAYVEGKMFWTLSSDQFTRHDNAPDLTKVRLLIYVKNLSAVEDFVRMYKTAGEEIFKANACPIILGGARVCVHEIVHALRWRRVFLNKVFKWIWMNGDWSISSEQMKNDAATPAKLVGYCFDAKQDSEFPADAGRLWENSVTGGNAIFEGNFCLIGVAVKNLSSNGVQTTGCADTSSKDQVYSENLSNADALAIMRDPSELVSIARRYAERLSANCLADYTLAKYVSCSSILCRCFNSKCD